MSRVKEIAGEDFIKLTANEIADLRQELEVNKSVYLVKNVVEKSLIEEIKNYLTQIGRQSFPAYHPILQGAPNHHRIVNYDPRSYVKGCFHQFSFFPWNQDVFNLFETLKPVYRVKNVLGGLDENLFLGNTPDMGCIARASFQFYPKGKGGLNRHADPVDKHQLVVPTLTMSKKGVDYSTGGLYVEIEDDKICVDDFSEPGDVVLFNASCIHGVDPVDPEEPLKWLDYQGRWMMVFAVNKLNDNSEIANAKDLS